MAGGQAVLFTAAVAGDFDNANIEVWSLRNNQRKTLQRGGMYGRYVAGHLVYVNNGTLFAAPMNLDRLELTRPAAPVVEEVLNARNNGGAQFAFSQNGDFVFVTGKGSGANSTVAWLDSSGKTQPLRGVPGIYFSPRFSPDGKQLALTVLEGGNTDIWVYEWERDTMSRLTFKPEEDSFPVWAPDGKHIAFRSARDGGVQNLYWMRSDGAGDAVRLTQSKNQQQTPYSFSPDGKRLAFNENTPESGWDLFTLPLDLTDPDHPKDGKWQISTGGGWMPVWSRNGKELFYRTPDNRIMVAAYTAKGDAFLADKPRIWAEKRFMDRGSFPNFDLAPDGNRFAVLMAPEGGDQKPPNHVTFLLNFSDELRRRVTGVRP